MHFFTARLTSCSALLLHCREARYFSRAHAVNLQYLPADFRSELPRVLLFVVLDFDFDEQIGNGHRASYPLY